MAPTFTRILVPVDFSAHSDAALDYARALATAFGASIHLLHVLEDPLVTGAWSSELYLPEMTMMRASLTKEAEGRLARCLSPADRERFRAVGHVLAGRPGATIVDFAADHHIDLIVMGTHGRSGIAHLLMGSVAERVMRGTSCPVLTVRDRATVRLELPVPVAAAQAPR